MTKKAVKFELATLSADVLVNVTELKAKQLEIVKNNPFVAIKDNETYILAKKHRTALKTARTDREKSDKTIGSVFSQVRKGAKLLNDEVIVISRPSEDAQQTEIDGWELHLAEKKNEKERLAKERAEGFTIKIQNYENELGAIYDGCKFDDLDNALLKSISIVNEIEAYDWEEFVLLADAMTERVNSFHEQAIKLIVDAENDRVKNIKIAQEAKVNEVFRICTTKIDAWMGEGEDVKDLEKYLKEECFPKDYDFGEFENSYGIVMVDVLTKARSRVDFVKSEKIRLAEQEATDQKNEVINYRESVLDSIELLDEKSDYLSYSVDLKLELKKMSFPLAKEEFDKASNRILSALSFKLTLIQNIVKEAKIKKDEADKKEKEILDKQKKAELKLSKANDQKEKARQLKLKPVKESAISVINSITIGYLFATDCKEVQDLMNGFEIYVKNIQEEYVKLITEL